MDTYRGYHIKQKRGLSHWDSLFEEWLLAVERYCRIMNGIDAPYWYNERANIGLLAAAAWRCGRIALEEFQFSKGEKYRPKWVGRADLWIASEHTEELIEAKFCWVSMKARREMKDIVAPAMDQAIQDARATKGAIDVRVLGVGFFPVYVPASQADGIDELIEETLEEFFTTDYHAIGWCFPKDVREAEPAGPNILPGIVMLVKNADMA